MSTNNIIERYGNLIKEESLVTMEDKILPNTFVLEAPEPFPGFYSYYSDAPSDSKPLYVYLVLNKQYTIEETTRATQNIKDYFKTNFSAAAGHIDIYNEQFEILRIRHLDSYDQIMDLQACYKDEGIEFKKKPKSIQGKGIIRLRKFFTLEELGDDMFFDVDEKDHGYFTIPRKLKWKEFEEITKKVKNNWDFSNFDAAVGHFHKNFCICDMIRIYNPKIDREYLEAAKKKYLERIK